MPRYPLDIIIESSAVVLNAVKELSDDYSKRFEIKIKTVTTALPSINDRAFTLVISGNKETVARFRKHRPINMFLVYCGDILDVINDQSALDDLIEDPVYRPCVKARLRWCFENIEQRLNAEFYKSTLLTTIDTVPDMLWFKKLDGQYPVVNETFSKVVDKPKEEIVGKTHSEIWDEKQFKEEAAAKTDLADGTVQTGITSITGDSTRSDGSAKQFTTYKSELRDPLGNEYGIVEVCSDIVSFENLSIELALIIETMPYPMIIFDTNWKTVSMNSHFREIIGESGAADFNYLQWKKEKLVPNGEPKVNAHLGSVSQEFSLINGSETCYYDITEFDIKDYFGIVQGHFCALMDFTYQRTYEQEILNAANTDALTGMYNRRFFYEYLNDNLKKSFYLLYLDLDNFKAVNDNYGHDVGDQVLIRVAQLIAKYFPNGVSARLGGDEFAVITESDSQQEIEKLAQAMEATVKKEFKMYECDLGISIGVVFNSGEFNGTDMLLHESDVRMYSIKKDHHNKEQ